MSGRSGGAERSEAQHFKLSISNSNIQLFVELRNRVLEEVVLRFFDIPIGKVRGETVDGRLDWGEWGVGLANRSPLAMKIPSDE